MHERMLALILAVVLVEMLLFLLKRRWLLEPFSIFVSILIAFVLQRVLRDHIVSTLWLGGWPGRNTSAFSTGSTWFLHSYGALKAFLIVLFGNIHSFVIKAFGIPVFAIIVCVVVFQFAKGAKRDMGKARLLKSRVD